ncbi:threonine/serine ThrE exporter family protein [Ornithinimicrobium tianjinense]|uniref:threonine/serine ThrE exporter family protein n=1 Tax=Ornithinimicrobium tianjinense TaxID=1195761 RepID=UPI00166DB8CB|nr:threonine/serine exporter family protein [Ornithinimicrobium tianjinense]
MTEPARTTETAEDRDRRLLAWLGAGMLAGGSPVHEAEDDVREVARALGHPNAQVTCMPTGVMVALAPGRATALERVEGGIRLDQVADVASLVAGLRAGRTTADEALARLATLRAQPHRYTRVGLPVGVVLSAVGIALILTPVGSSVLFAAVLAPVTVLLLLLSRSSRAVRTLVPLAASFATSVAAFTAASAGWVEAPLWTLVAPIAVILPGATIVTGLTELAAGSMVAGTGRLAHGTLQMLLFALGVGGAAGLLRVDAALLDPARPVGLGWWAPLLGVVVVTVAISLMESLPPHVVPWVLLTVLATYLAQAVGQEVLGMRWAGAFVGALVAGLAASLVEFVRPELPRAVAFLPSFWLLVPGSLGLISVAQADISPAVAAGAVWEVTLVVVALALGVAVGANLASPLRGAARRTGLVHLLGRWRRGRA